MEADRPARWLPDKAHLEYVRLLLTVMLLVLVFPLVLARLIAAPHAAADKVIGSVR